MRRWAVITLSIAAIAAHATPARAATSSTYTQYATPRTLTAGELAVLGCDAAAQYPGSDAAAGAPDGAGWAVDTSASQCAGTPDEAFLVPDFPRLRCTSYAGITGLHVRALTLPGQTISLTSSEWVVGVIANNSLVPFATGEIDSAGGTSDIDFSFIAPTNTAAIFNPAVTMVFGLDSKENLIYDIDAFSFVITGDLSACHIDQDGDGLDNVAEKAHGTDPLKADTDGGGVDDGTEVARGSDPLDARDDATGHLPTTTSTTTTTTTVPELPRTGSSTAAPLGVVAAGAVALGSLLAFAGRRRRGER